jgi:hypothetical protein
MTLLGLDQAQIADLREREIIGGAHRAGAA